MTKYSRISSYCIPGNPSSYMTFHTDRSTISLYTRKILPSLFFYQCSAFLACHACLCHIRFLRSHVRVTIFMELSNFVSIYHKCVRSVSLHCQFTLFTVKILGWFCKWFLLILQRMLASIHYQKNRWKNGSACNGGLFKYQWQVEKRRLSFSPRWTSFWSTAISSWA